MTVPTALPPCTVCGRAVRPQRAPATPGTVRYGGKGKCAACYQTQYRAKKKADRDARRAKSRRDHARKAPTTTVETPPPPPLIDLTPDPQADWREDALCAQTDPTIFFPERSSEGTHAAKKICQACPVQTECLQFALDNDEPHGIWGGMAPRTRNALKRRGSAAA